MSESEAKVALSVDHLQVDKVSIWNRGNTSTLVSLTPVLSVLLAVVGLLVGTSVQVWQSRTSEAESVDAAWRVALEKLSPDDQQAVIGALEMQTFFGDKRHSDQARELNANLVPRIRDPRNFDTAFFQAPGGISGMSTRHLAFIARSVTDELHSIHELAIATITASAVPVDQSFEAFLKHPENLLDDRTHADLLQRAQNEAWKLDSVTGAMCDAWKRKTATISAGADLSGIVFLNHDFTTTDFRQATLDGASFVGRCVVNPALLPSGVTTHCEP